MSDTPWRLIVRRLGGPEVIERDDFEPGTPGPGELLVAQEAVGLNYADTYYRTGLYPAELPLALGTESAGRVIATGPGVAAFAIGDRVAALMGPGAYATHRIVRADHTVAIPDDISFEAAVAALGKGLTVYYLAEKLTALTPAQTVLVHSAAGGVGSILVPWLRDKGVTVIAHAGTPAKAAGVDADHSLSGSFERLAEQVRALTGGRGVDVVYDGVGKDSWSASIACLKRRGLMVSYGNASGPVPPVSPLELLRGGSLFLTRPTLADYLETPEEVSRGASELFDRMQRGVVKAVIGQRFALADAAEAHRALEARQTTGSTVLVP